LGMKERTPGYLIKEEMQREKLRVREAQEEERGSLRKDY